jgi:hypothetical protein
MQYRVVELSVPNPDGTRSKKFYAIAVPIGRSTLHL